MVAAKPARPLVLDNSVVLAWFMAEERTAEARELLAGLAETELLVPALWWTELANGLVISCRRGRMTEAQLAVNLNLIESLRLETDAPNHDKTERLIGLATEHGLTAYDAAYLELVLRREAILATFDTELWIAADRAGAKLATRAN